MNLGHWQFLTGFFQFSFVKLFISWFAIVPVAVYIFRKIPEVIILSTAPDVFIELQFGLPFNWIILWMASLAFVFAAVLFAVFCPSFIKRHDTFPKYRDLGHSPRWVVWEVHYALEAAANSWIGKYKDTKPMRDRFVTKGLATLVPDEQNPIPDEQNSCVVVEGDRSTVYFRHDAAVYSMYSKQAPSEDDDRENDIFWELFGYLAKTHPCIRLVIKWSIYLAFLGVVAVVVQNIWFAFEYVC